MPPSAPTSPDRPLVHDWNAGAAFAWSAARVAILDETLRDGLQSPSATNPSAEAKRALLHQMAAVGVRAVNVGVPAAGGRALGDAVALVREIADAGLALEAVCAGRTTAGDVEAIARVAQRAGAPVRASVFVGSSTIRRFAEGWTLDEVVRATDAAVRLAVREGLPVTFVTEDSTRAEPDALRALYTSAVQGGASRLCLADTVGHATPAGTTRLVRFMREQLFPALGTAVALEWHGHRDRGLGIANALAAIEAGVEWVHATALGVGERVGNVELELLVANLHLLGAPGHALAAVPAYVEAVARALALRVPRNQPVVGADAFRTGTGTHAAALVKAAALGSGWLADRVYAALPAADLGRTQRIELSHVSGRANARYWLAHHGYRPDDEGLVDTLLAAARAAARPMVDAELHALCAARGVARGVVASR